MIAISMYGPQRRRTVRRNRTGGMPEPLLGDTPDKTTAEQIDVRRTSDYGNEADSPDGDDEGVEDTNKGSSVFQKMIGGPFGNAGENK